MPGRGQTNNFEGRSVRYCASFSRPPPTPSMRASQGDQTADEGLGVRPDISAAVWRAVLVSRSPSAPRTPPRPWDLDDQMLSPLTHDTPRGGIDFLIYQRHQHRNRQHGGSGQYTCPGIAYGRVTAHSALAAPGCPTKGGLLRIYERAAGLEGEGGQTPATASFPPFPLCCVEL